MKTYDIIVIGAGISGLSLAHYCAQAGRSTLVLEKSQRAGGLFHSHKIATAGEDFWLELGAHTCYNSYAHLIDLLQDCRIADQMMKRKKAPYKMLVDGRLASIPSQLNFIELLTSVPRLLFEQKTKKTIATYYSKILGKGNFQRVFSPLFSAVPSQNADQFPADILFKKRRRRKDVLKSFTMKQGLQSIADTIASQPGIELMKEQEVTAIEECGDICQITTTAGSILHSRAVALSTPASVSARLLESSFPQIAQQLAQIEVKEVESLGVGVRQDAFTFAPIAGAVPLDDAFYSIVSRDVVPHQQFRGFTFHFKPGILDRTAKLQRVGQVLGIAPERIDHIVEQTHLIPSLTVGHHELIHTIDELIGDKRLLLTGNYFAGLSIEDCISRSRSQFLRLQEIL